ncbi:PREDICTED: copper-transporting ATPase PAA1, chloroplastic-like isoform X2 [Lupinus angustifolius]|nr:PREDICTED: copper-transporting ATPase PAA1, chloroplastic-like isoform X2 [Lupinus angustifolius]
MELAMTTTMKPHALFIKPNNIIQTQFPNQLFFKSSAVNLFSLRCSASSGAGAGVPITLHVGGMMCEGCASTVKRILETQPQVSSATVNLASQTATVIPAIESEKEELGEALAHHLSTSGFTSTFPSPGQEDAE